MTSRKSGANTDVTTQRAKRPRLDMTSSKQTPTGGGRSGKRSGQPTSAAAAAAAGGAGPLGRQGLLDRTQYIRLLEQALASLGFTDVADQLEQASGVASQPPQVRAKGYRRTYGWAGGPHCLHASSLLSAGAAQGTKPYLLS